MHGTLLSMRSDVGLKHAILFAVAASFSHVNHVEDLVCIGHDVAAVAVPSMPACGALIKTRLPHMLS